MIELTRRAYFCAGHRYWRNDWTPEKNRQVFGACANEHGHGHNYAVDVTVAGEIDADTGMVLNLTDLDRLIQERVIDHLDHRNLNHDVPALRDHVPTTEALAGYVWDCLAGGLAGGRLVRVRVYESDDLWAECARGDDTDA